MNTPLSRLVTQPRRLRLFVSSTFTDMLEERRLLEREVFPKIRRLCQKRAVEFYAVNLAWGIPDDVRLGEVIDVCLREVRECHPFFLGFMGQRYGRIQDRREAKTAEKIDKLVEVHPDLQWLLEHLPASVTDLEIQQALRLGIQKDIIQFYDREEAYLAILSETVRFRVKDGQREDLFVEVDSEVQAKLQQLKQQLREAQIPIARYATPQQGAHFALERLTAWVNEKFPADRVPEALMQKRSAHNAFAASRREVYLRREADFARLTQLVEAEAERALVITGESGAGKTALLANWAVEYERTHPQRFIFWHFIGSSPDSAAVKELLQRLCEELKAQFPLALGQREVASDEDTLIRTLPEWLANVPERIVVIIDGLNQLFEKEQRLTWLPAFVPPHVRLVVSTVAGIALEQLQQREWPRFTLALLDERQRRKLVEDSLQKSGKALKSEQLDLIVQAEYTANPLYLKVLLRELAIEGQHRTLGEQIQTYLEAHDLTALYDQVLARFEKYYSRETMTRVWSALWATRYGLTEEELLALSEVSKLAWATLSAGLLDVVALVNRDGLLNFYHQYVQKAVAKRYVATVELQQAAHRTLAVYFAQQELDWRIANLLPYHWFKAGDKMALKACIGQITIMSYHADEYELLKYWREVADYEEMENTYVWAFLRIRWQILWLAFLRFLRLSKRYPPYWNLHKLARLLETAGRYGKITTILRNQIVKADTKQSGQDSTETATSLNNLAALYRVQGKYDQAEPLYQRSLAIREQVLGAHHPDVATSLNNLAWLYQAQGKYEQAEPLYRRSLAIWEQVFGAHHPYVATSLNGLAGLYQAQGKYDQAEPLYLRSLAIREQVFGPHHPDVASSLNNLAGLYYNQGKYEQAEPLVLRSLAIWEQVFGPHHPDVASSLNNLAGLYEAQGKYDQAEPLFLRSLAIVEQVFGAHHPDVASSLNNLALLYKAQSKYDQAEPLYLRSLAINEQVFGPHHPDVASSLNNLAALYQAQGKYAQAEPLSLRSLAIREQIFGAYHPAVAESLNNLAALYQAQGKYDQSEPLYMRAIAILEQRLGVEHPSTKTVRKNYEINQQKRIAQESSPKITSSQISRNAPCPCGSGKRYKECCGKV